MLLIGAEDFQTSRMQLAQRRTKRVARRKKWMENKLWWKSCLESQYRSSNQKKPPYKPFRHYLPLLSPWKPVRQESSRRKLSGNQLQFRLGFRKAQLPLHSSLYSDRELICLMMLFSSIPPRKRRDAVGEMRLVYPVTRL